MPVLSLLIKSRLFRSDANLYDIFYQTVTYAATTSYVYNRPLYAQLSFDLLYLIRPGETEKRLMTVWLPKTNVGSVVAASLQKHLAIYIPPTNATADI